MLYLYNHIISYQVQMQLPASLRCIGDLRSEVRIFNFQLNEIHFNENENS